MTPFFVLVWIGKENSAVSSSSYKDTNPYDPNLILTTFLEVPSPNTPTLGLGFNL